MCPILFLISTVLALALWLFKPPGGQKLGKYSIIFNTIKIKMNGPVVAIIAPTPPAHGPLYD
jgi:hypothetical protein